MVPICQAQRMKHFRKWAENKNPIMVELIPMLIRCMDTYLESVEGIKKQERVEGYVPLPPINQWLGFYRKHHKIYQSIIEAVAAVSPEIGKKVKDFYVMSKNLKLAASNSKPKEALKVFNKLPLEEQKKILDTAKKDETYSAMGNMITIANENEDVHLAHIDEKNKKRLMEIFTQPEVLFFMNVWAPCLMIYGEFPTTLLFRARHGDIDAIEKLVRLDKSIIHDPRMMNIHHQASKSKNKETFNRITKALGSRPQAKTKRRQVKYYFGGLLSNFSVALGQKMPASDIEDLFDALARDKGIDNIDPDFIDINAETFEKGIQRARKMWNISSLVDKK